MKRIIQALALGANMAYAVTISLNTEVNANVDAAGDAHLCPDEPAEGSCQIYKDANFEGECWVLESSYYD